MWVWGPHEARPTQSHLTAAHTARCLNSAPGAPERGWVSVEVGVFLREYLQPKS